MKKYKYLIVGGGMTSNAAVKGIRELDETGEIGIISAEPDPPYARPPLSKGLWTGDKSLDDIWYTTEQNGVSLVQSRRVMSLNRDQQEITDDRENVYHYEYLLLATGGSPRRLPFDKDQVIYYRTLEDYRRLRKLSEQGNRIAILGGGFIGAELAAALRMNDKQVTMIFPETALCGLLLPTEIASSLNKHYENRGVTVVTGRKPSSIDVENGALSIHIENGQTLSVDGIVAGVGIDPDTQLAEAAGLDVDDGIIVDENLRTKDPRIFAAGDVANFHNPVLDRRMRVEHEDNALTMGEMAGRNMAGEKEAYHHLPYFYSDLFDLGYEAVGETDLSLDILTDLKDPGEKGCIFYMQENRVRGVVFWNLFDKVDAGRELIAAPGPHTKDKLRHWTKERLAD